MTAELDEHVIPDTEWYGNYILTETADILADNLLRIAIFHYAASMAAGDACPVGPLYLQVVLMEDIYGPQEGDQWVDRQVLCWFQQVIRDEPLRRTFLEQHIQASVLAEMGLTT